MNVLLLHLIERRDEKKRLDHLKQDQTRLLIRRFSERKKRIQRSSAGGPGGPRYIWGPPIFDGAFGGVGDEVVVGEGVVRFSSSFVRSTNSCFGGMMVSLIFLKPWEEEALVESMVEGFEEDEDDKKSEKDGLFN
ncbi:hypothetical protein Tco_0538277 [Tanacetum coccineum]